MNIKQFMPKFLKELRSGNWDQTTGNLIKKNDFEDISYCVIGVACKVAGAKDTDLVNRERPDEVYGCDDWGQPDYPDYIKFKELFKYSGSNKTNVFFTYDRISDLIDLNDDDQDGYDKWSFKSLADEIEYLYDGWKEEV
tara:strand:- start:26354 stop:26770 length:417 start_codon:yes stop_codon:yes gene_type:complete